MAVAFDAVGPGAAGSTPTGTKPVTWAHTCTGGNGLLLVGVVFDAVTIATLGTLTVTYATVPMTLVGSWPAGGAGQTVGVVAVWKKITPATGSNTVSVSWSTGTPDTVIGGSLSFTGADQTTGIGSVTDHDSAGASVTAWTTGTITTTTGNMLVAFTCNGSGGTTFTAGTLRWAGGAGGGGAAGFGAGGTIASTGSDSIGGAQNSDYSGTMGFEVLAAPAGTLAALASGAGAALSAGIYTSNVVVGPRYATAAADLGGGSGSWATPQYAEGGP